MLLNDSLHDGQALPVPSKLGVAADALEDTEQLVPVFHIEADSVVFHAIDIRAVRVGLRSRVYLKAFERRFVTTCLSSSRKIRMLILDGTSFKRCSTYLWL